MIFLPSSYVYLTAYSNGDYEKGINDVLVQKGYLMNSFHAALWAPPETHGVISSYLTEGKFSASHGCHHRRPVLILFPSRISFRRIPRTIGIVVRLKLFLISDDTQLPKVPRLAYWP